MPKEISNIIKSLQNDVSWAIEDAYRKGYDEGKEDHKDD